jgi:group I intron endonuclease
VLYFIYKTYSPSGFYYYGRHSTLDINDGYLGSGNWIKSIKNKSNLKRDIILFCENEQELIKKEEEYLKKYINDPKCMNFNEKSTGFSSLNNPNKLIKGSKILSERIKGEKNGMYGKTHSDEYKKYLSENMKGEKNPFYGKTHTEETKEKISKSNKGRKFSPEVIEKLKNRFPGTTHPASKLNREQILEIYNLSWEGKLTQTEIAKKFNIRQGHVTKIKNGQLWQKITNHNNQIKI